MSLVHACSSFADHDVSSSESCGRLRSNGGHQFVIFSIVLTHVLCFWGRKTLPTISRLQLGFQIIVMVLYGKVAEDRSSHKLVFFVTEELQKSECYLLELICQHTTWNVFIGVPFFLVGAPLPLSFEKLATTTSRLCCYLIALCLL